MKYVCHAEGNKCYIHEDVNLQNVNFMAIRKPMKVSNNNSGIILNFYGSATYGSWEAMRKEYDNL